MNKNENEELTNRNEVTLKDVIKMHFKMYLSNCINNARGPLLSVGETLVDYWLEWLDEKIRR